MVCIILLSLLLYISFICYKILSKFFVFFLNSGYNKNKGNKCHCGILLVDGPGPFWI